MIARRHERSGGRLGMSRLVLAAILLATPCLAQESSWIDQYLHPLCLTPEAGRVLQELADGGALAAALPKGLTIRGGAIDDASITLTIAGAGESETRLVLTLSSAAVGTPAFGQGRKLGYHLVALRGESPDPDRLLALAERIDAALPQAAFERCARGAPIATDRRFPLSWMLTAAGLQLIAIAAAIAYGLRATRA